MSKLMAVLTAFKTILKTYPAMSAALINFGVFAAGYFGLHITAEQLVAAVGVLDVLFGVIVHSNVVPLPKHEAEVATALATPVPVYNATPTHVVANAPSDIGADVATPTEGK